MYAPQRVLLRFLSGYADIRSETKEEWYQYGMSGIIKAPLSFAVYYQSSWSVLERVWIVFRARTNSLLFFFSLPFSFPTFSWPVLFLNPEEDPPET